MTVLSSKHEVDPGSGDRAILPRSTRQCSQNVIERKIPLIPGSKSIEASHGGILVEIAEVRGLVPRLVLCFAH